MSGTAGSEPPAELDRGALVRDSLRASALLGALACGLAVLFGAPQLAISIALGLALAAVNFLLLARGLAAALDGTRASAAQARSDRGLEADAELTADSVGDRPRRVGSPLRLALMLAALAALAWLAPAPEGLAIGVAVVLIAASLAAIVHNKRRRSSGTPPG